jgi:mono/diheme cytochrome c family protein
MTVKHAGVMSGIALLSVAAVLATPTVAAAQSSKRAATFARDVAPIFQRSCQQCHRPGSIAPMSLLTYDEARPWARSIKARVSAREMPPWFIDRNIGVQRFKNDISLNDDEIAAIVNWVDAGAPLGDPKDLPPPATFPDITAWQIGTPDLVVEMPGELIVKAVAPDWWGDVVTEIPAVAEDRYIKAVEVKPIKGYDAIHHAVASIVADETPADGGGTLVEYSLGKNGDIYPDGTGRLLPAGARISWNMHLHSNGEQKAAKVAIAFQFYPKGYVPKHRLRAQLVGGDKETQLDIPAGHDNVRMDTYATLGAAAVLTQFEAHMHNRGKAMCLEAIYPSGSGNNRAGGVKTETLSCVDRFNFGWLRSYTYADEAQPLLPAGTILHIISWHNNSASNKQNYDSTNWIGFGNRTIDDMAHMWVNYYSIDEDDYKARVEARKVKAATNQQ